jgi:surface polysaccharide O-acyltransferase-like enzyme
MSQTHPTPISTSIRRNDLDWLRVLAVLLLVPFHSALVFVQDPHSIMYVKDALNSAELVRIASFIHQFHMPLLFFIAGASSYYALGVRSAGQYLQERVKRLLVPALFGMIVLLPPMTYITQISRGRAVSFWQHYLGFFQVKIYDLAGIGGSFTPGHLWFILYLFIFSLLALPVFVWLRQDASGQRVTTALQRLFARPGAILLFAIPLTLAAAVDLLGDKNPLYYFLVFFLGYLLVSGERYQAALDRVAPFALSLGIVFEILRQTWRLYMAPWSPTWIAFGIIENLNRWLWVVALLGLGHYFLNHRGKILAYLSEAAFPFYILHLPIDTLVAYFIIRLPVGVAPKYLLIVVLTTILTFAIYEAVKRVAPLRFFMGLKPSNRARQYPAPAVPVPLDQALRG